MLASLKELPRVELDSSSALASFTDGILQIDVRTERAQSRTRQILENVDLSTFFPGCRNLDIRIGTGGSTGKELRDQAEVNRRLAAERAATDSLLIKQLIAVFDGHLESVEPTMRVVQDMPPSNEDGPDE